MHKFNLQDKIINFYHDNKFGIKTSGVVEVQNQDSVHYATFSYHTIFQILNHLKCNKSDIFIDLGCGKGRVLCCAAQFKLGKVIGVELDKKIFEAGEKNILKLKTRITDVEIKNIPAEIFNYQNVNKIFLFNPFGMATLKKVLEKIEISLKESPHKFQIIYVNPIHENLFKSIGWLSQVEKWEKNKHSHLEHDVSFWGTNY